MSRRLPESRRELKLKRPNSRRERRRKPRELPTGRFAKPNVKLLEPLERPRELPDVPREMLTRKQRNLSRDLRRMLWPRRSLPRQPRKLPSRKSRMLSTLPIKLVEKPRGKLLVPRDRLSARRNRPVARPRELSLTPLNTNKLTPTSPIRPLLSLLPP